MTGHSPEEHDALLRRIAETDDRARMIAVELVGLTVTAAQAHVAEHPGLTLRELSRDQEVTLEFRSGRINVIVDDGIVTEARLG